MVDADVCVIVSHSQLVVTIDILYVTSYLHVARLRRCVSTSLLLCPELMCPKVCTPLSAAFSLFLQSSFTPKVAFLGVVRRPPSLLSSPPNPSLLSSKLLDVLPPPPPPLS